MKKSTGGTSRRSKRKKRTPYAIAKDAAWAAFSKFIRKRDCLATTGFSDSGACFTCGRVYPFGQLQGGHFISRSHMAVMFDETNVHAQCGGCNLKPPYGKGGNYIEYTAKMIDKYGREHVDWLREQRGVVRKYKTAELKELKNEYEKKFAQL